MASNSRGKWLKYGGILLGLLMSCFIALLLLHKIFTRQGVSYVVDGALLSYVLNDKGKVAVQVLQSDGVVRQYDTEATPESCNQHVTGIGVQVIVTPYVNSVFQETHYDSQLAVDPCGK